MVLGRFAASARDLPVAGDWTFARRGLYDEGLRRGLWQPLRADAVQ